MGKRITLIMTLAVLAGFTIIIVMNVAALLGYIPPKYISPNDVKGMAVEHNHILYTLSFDQQNVLVDIFNRAIPVAKEAFNARKINVKNPPAVDKIIIYRFNAPDIEIIPEGFVSKSISVSSDQNVQDHMVFSAPLWNPLGYMEEVAADEMQKVLLTTYDP